MKKHALLTILATTFLLTACSLPEKPLQPSQNQLEQLGSTREEAGSDSGQVLAALMKSAAADTASHYKETGYCILEEDPGLARDIQAFCEDGVFYRIETARDVYTSDGNSVFVTALASDGKTQANINGDQTVQGQLVVQNVFERNPVYAGTPEDMMAQPLLEVISCQGLEIIEAYPSSFTAWKETGTGEDGSPVMTVRWTIPDQDALTTILSRSRFSKTGNIFPVENAFSFTLKQEGADWILQDWSTGRGTGTVTGQDLEAETAFWKDTFANLPAIGDILAFGQ